MSYKLQRKLTSSYLRQLQKLVDENLQQNFIEFLNQKIR